MKTVLIKIEKVYTELIAFVDANLYRQLYIISKEEHAKRNQIMLEIRDKFKFKILINNNLMFKNIIYAF